MGYVAVTGGAEAIEAWIEHLKYERLRMGRTLRPIDVQAGMRALVDQVMSKASLYDEAMAALSIKQAEGSPEEAVFPDARLPVHLAALPLLASRRLARDARRAEDLGELQGHTGRPDPRGPPATTRTA